MSYYTDMISKAIGVLDELNIPYAKKTLFSVDNPKRRYGQCTKVSDDSFKVTVAQRLINTHNDNEVVATIIHELLHTCPGGFTHTGEWKRLAMYVTRKTEYTITRTSYYNDAETLNYKYKAVCDGCGQQFTFLKRTKVVNHLLTNRGNCTCPTCRGKKFSLYNAQCLLISNYGG